jgi:hypothetical protein
MIKSWLLLITAFMAVVLVALSPAGVAEAQDRDVAQSSPKANTMLPAYDLTKEVKIQGTIQEIVTETDALGGTHIQVQTAGGIMDVQLGFGAASKPANLGIVPGQNVSVIGMVHTAGSSSVLLARVLTTPSHIFVLRNEHGIPVRATPRGGAHAGALQKG